MLRNLLVLIAISFVLRPVAATAAPVDLTTLSLEQLLDVEVVSVSKFSQRISAAPSSVTNITAEDIRSYGYRSLADVLKSVRGFNVSSDRLYSYVGVRGFAPPGDYNDRLLVMIDGYRINDVIYDQAFIGSEFPLDLDLVDHIEIVRGPGSSVHGSNALFGVVNVVTRMGADLAGSEISAEAGSYRYGKGRLSVGRRLTGGGDLLLSMSGESARGATLEFPEFALGNSTTSGTDFLRNKRFFGKFTQGGFSIFGGLSQRTKGNPGALNSGVFDDPRNQVVDEQGFLDARYTRKLGSATELTGRFYAGLTNFDGAYLQPGSLRMNLDLARGRWWGAELKGLTPLAASHKLAYGIEYQADTRQDFTNYDLDPQVIYLRERRSSKRTSLYLQDEWQVMAQLSLILGLRYDHLADQENQLSPRLAAIWKLSERTLWKFIYGTAFRAPNIYELYYSYPAQQSANAALKPEKIHTYETTFEHYLQPSLRLSASAYYYLMERQISQITDAAGLLQFQNMPDARGRGLEFEGEKLWEGGARLRASLGLQRPTDFAGQLPVNTPRTLIKLNYTQPLFAARWRVGAEVQHGSARLASTGTIGGNAIANLTLLRTLVKDGWEFSASLYNLFDRRYGDPVGDDALGLARISIPADGRTLRLKLTTRF